MVQNKDIPIINLGSPFRNHLKDSKRPEEVYVRLTYETLGDMLSTEEKEEKLLRWLAYGVLPGLSKEKFIVSENNT